MNGPAGIDAVDGAVAMDGAWGTVVLGVLVVIGIESVVAAGARVVVSDEVDGSAPPQALAASRLSATKILPGLRMRPALVGVTTAAV